MVPLYSDSIQLIYTTPYIQSKTIDGTNKHVLKFTTYYKDTDCIIFQAYNSTKDRYSDVKINFSITSDLRFADCTFASAMINKSSAPFPAGVVVIDQRPPLVEVTSDGHSSVMKAADMSNEISAQTPDVIAGATDYGTISITPITTSTGKYRIYLPDGTTEYSPTGGTVRYDSPFAAIYQLTKIGAKNGYLVKDTTQINAVVFQYSSTNMKYYVFRGKNFHGTTTNSDHMRNFTSNYPDVHIVRSDGIYATTEVSIDQPYAHSSKLHSPNGTVVPGFAGEGNTGAYIYRTSNNNNKYYKMTETIDLNNMKLRVNNDVNNKISRNGFIYISSSMNNGKGWTSCDLGLVVNGDSLDGQLKLTAYLHPSLAGQTQKYENKDKANLIKPKDKKQTDNGTISEYSYTGIYTLTYEFVSEYIEIRPGEPELQYGMKCILKNGDQVYDTITLLVPDERVIPNPSGETTNTSYVNFTAGTSFVPNFHHSGGTLDNISSGDELTGIKRSNGRIYYCNDGKQNDKWYYQFDGNLQTTTTKAVTQYMTDKVSYTRNGSVEIINISYKD